MTDFEAALASLQETLAYQFRDQALLAQALGALNPPLTPQAASARQRLEFLGDAAWNFAVAVLAFQVWPLASAGDLTRFRAAWCSTTGLAHLARRIGLPEPGGLAPSGPSERLSSETPRADAGRVDRPSPPRPSDRVLAEMLEAVVGAMVEDGGLQAVQVLARRVITQKENALIPPPVDSKSALQMLAQARFATLPVYRLIERRGPPHHPTFRVGVRVIGGGADVHAEGEGGTRQTAEQDAARLALLRLAEGSES